MTNNEQGNIELYLGGEVKYYEKILKASLIFLFTLNNVALNIILIGFKGLFFII